MKVTALGVHSAFAVGESIEATGSVTGQTQKLYKPKFQSNFLLEFQTDDPKKPYRFVIDFGSDIRHSLMYSAGLKMGDIDAWYCSHPHADHVGGIEGIALSTFFNPFWKGKNAWLEEVTPGQLHVINAYLKKKMPDKYKPELFAHEHVLEEIWQAARPGLNTLQGMRNVNLATYFKVQSMDDDTIKRIKDGDRTWKFYTVNSTHVISGMGKMPSFGLRFECSDGQVIFFPTDTMYMIPEGMETLYRTSDVVYQDAETGPKSGVHSHIDDIEKSDKEIKRKLYLYHYSEEPKVDESQYRGILRTGDVHNY